MKMDYKISLDPISNSQLTISLFKNVKNTQEVRKKLMDGELKCCIVKPSLIPHPFIITLAANKALVAEKITTKSIFTEILFNLSISKNITQSLQNFGIHDDDKEILVVTVGKVGEEESCINEIKGEQIEINCLDEFVNLKAVQKMYKLKDTEVKGDLLAAICNRIAIKDFA